MFTYFIDPIKNHYVDFMGRATRKQFWLFVLWSFIVFLILRFLLGFVGDTGNAIYWVCQLAILLPTLAIACRRLRDGGFSPWWILIWLIPFIGWIALLIMCLFPSK